MTVLDDLNDAAETYIHKRLLLVGCDAKMASDLMHSMIQKYEPGGFYTAVVNSNDNELRELVEIELGRHLDELK
jgi:hypothetical protein